MDLATQSDEAILAVVDPMMDNLMQASAEIDHAAHVRDFTDRLKEIVTPEHLGPLRRCMAPGAVLRVATDIGDYVRQTLEEVPRAGFT